MSYVEDLQRGLNAVQAGRKAEARSAFRAVLRRDPTNETALLGLAYLADDPRAAMSYVVRALNAHPGSPRSHGALRWARKQLATAPSPRVTEEAVLLSSDAYRTTLKVAGGLALLMSLIIVGVIVTWAMGWVPPGHPPAVAAVVSPPTPTPSPTPSPLPPSATPTPIPPTPTSPPARVPVPASDLTPTPDPSPTPLPPSPAAPLPTPIPTTAVTEWRWIDVNLTHQVLVAYERDTPVRTMYVSTGLPHTPTPTGRFHIYVKYHTDDMSGPGYYLVDVPYVMYFYRGYGLHGTYWHDNFGQPMSHGCVNLPTPDAEWLYNWAPEGTLVNIHY
jgi:lipoprotein-anchoring transpeptidase ErfK/SrfK